MGPDFVAKTPASDFSCGSVVVGMGVVSDAVATFDIRALPG